MRLERLLRPKSIAVIGGGFFATNVVAQCKAMGFSGDIWPVHPGKDEIAGVRAYRSVADLPAAPDASFVGVNRHATIEIVRDLSARGAGGAVCFAAGFREADAEDADGARLQEELIAAAGAMPIIGPNCYGLINYCDGALLWPDQHGGRRLEPGERGVAILTQSSNIAINMTMQTRGLPIAYLLTAGNQAQTGLSEMALGVIEDERVTAVGLHIEGFDSIASFERLAARARELGKPVVAMKVGRSPAAQAATISHTASLAGSDDAARAFLKRIGIGQVSSIPSFLETLKLLHLGGPLNGNRLASMSCSGGEASVMADAAEGRCVFFPPLGADHAARVKETLGPLVAVANPLDYNTFIWNDEPAMRATFASMVSGGFDLIMLVLDFPRADRCSDRDWWPTIAAFETALDKQGARGAIVASLPENISESHARALMARDIVPLLGIEEALVAAEAAAAIGEVWRKAMPPALGHVLCGASAPVEGGEEGLDDEARLSSPHTGGRGGTRSVTEWGEASHPAEECEERRGMAARTSFFRGGRNGGSPPLAPAHKGEGDGGGALDEAEAKGLLAAAGLPVPPGQFAEDAAHALSAGIALGFPVALKALGLAHKSEAGAVRLNIRDAATLSGAARELAPLGTGLYVERMVEDAEGELIVGVTRDPVFGPVMTIGTGGVLVELLKDSVTLLLPATREEIEAALRGLRLFPLLDGYRGRPRGDVAAAVDAIAAIAAFVHEHTGDILEMDINPLIVCAEGRGAWIADALIVCPATSTLWGSRRRALADDRISGPPSAIATSTDQAGRPLLKEGR